MNSLAHRRINWASVAYERPKRFPDIVPDDQIGDVILLGRFVVDNHQFGAAVLGHHRKAGGRPDHQRRSDRDKQVAMLGKFSGAAHRVFRHRLPERNGGGLYRLVADGAVGRAATCIEALLDPAKIVGSPAADAARVGGIAVQVRRRVRRANPDI